MGVAQMLESARVGAENNELNAMDMDCDDVTGDGDVEMRECE